MSAIVTKPIKHGVITPAECREDFLRQMNWTVSRGTTSRSDADVSVNLNAKGKNTVGQNLGITLRHGVSEMISGTEYAQICIHKNRIYFRESDSRQGYKMTKNHQNEDRSATPASRENRYMKVTNLSETSKAFIGDYELKYDDFLELYYIEKEV